MRKHDVFISRVVVTIVLLLVVSCTTSEVLREVMDPKNILSSKTKLDLKINVDPDLNPDQHGRPSPVVARIYSLSSPSIFEHSDFVSLYHNDKQVLGADYLRREEKNFRPSEIFEAQLEFDEKASFVGFMVAYQDIEQAQWRLVFPLERKQHNYISLRLTRNRIVLEQE